jgi:magnesium transporter
MQNGIPLTGDQQLELIDAYGIDEPFRSRDPRRDREERRFCEESTGSMSTKVAVYEDGKKTEGKYSLSDASAVIRDPRAVVWISLVEPSKEELDSVVRQFGLQQLAQEDTETRRRVILSYEGRWLTLMVNPARYLSDSGTVGISELDVFLEERLAITVLRGDGLEMHDVEQSLEESSDLSRLGAGAILHALVYQVVNDYASVVDRLGDDLLDLEGDLLKSNDGVTNRLYELSREVTNRLYELSREVVKLQRVIEHLGVVLDSLTDPESQYPGSNSKLPMRLRGLLRRVQWINSKVSGFIGLLQNLFSVNLTLVSVQQNDQSRTISAWAAIIAVPTVIGAIYGMNFQYMPELGLRFGYPLVLLVMVASCIVLYVIFKRTGWL